MYDSKWVEGYFDEFGHQEWDRLVKSPAREVQFAVHQNVLHRHLTRGSEVLEIGAGPGRFTNQLHQLGCRITVADISHIQLDLNREKAKEHGFDASVVDWHQLDICDLSIFPDESHDAVVAFGGPFSYVMDRRDVALEECKRVLRPGGKLLISVMCLFGTIHQYLDGVLGIPWADNEKIIATGDLTKGSSEFTTHYCHMFRSQELRTFLESHDLKVIDMAAANVLTPVHGESLLTIRQDEAKWQQVLQMEILASREPGCLDAGTHIIAVAQK